MKDDLNCVKSRHEAGATVSDDFRSVTEACKRPKIRAKRTQLRKDCSTTPSTAAFLALLTDRDGLRNRCEALMLENKCIFELAVLPRELREKLVDREKIDATAKTSPRVRWSRRATAAA